MRAELARHPSHRLTNQPNRCRPRPAARFGRLVAQALPEPFEGGDIAPITPIDFAAQFHVLGGIHAGILLQYNNDLFQNIDVL